MSAAPELFRRERPSQPMRATRRTPLMTDPREEMLAPVDASKRHAEEQAERRFWQWLAVAVLMFCWIAEASMCAVRGF